MKMYAGGAYRGVLTFWILRLRATIDHSLSYLSSRQRWDRAWNCLTEPTLFIMTVIAVVGGTGGVGKTLVERLLLEPNKFRVIVLSRGVSDSK